MTAPRPVPYTESDEAALLCAALLNRPAALLVAQRTAADDFHVPFHQRVRVAVGHLVEAGAPVDTQTVAFEIARSNGADADATKQRVLELLEAGGVIAHAEAYLTNVKECALRRRVLQLANALGEAAAAGGPTEPLLHQAADLGRGGSLRLDNSRLLAGGDFLFSDERSGDVPLVGRGDEVLHMSGEPTLVVGPTGGGKSTLAQNYVGHRAGILPGDLLGFPVRPLAENEVILYVAADRPRQIRRSFARLIAPEMRDQFSRHVIVWKGPLPFLLNDSPLGLVQLAREIDAARGVRVVEIILDSLKDVARELHNAEGAEAVAHAVAQASAEGLDVLGLHHDRKPQVKRTAKSIDIDAVYGGTFLTACAGNVLYLLGVPGAHVLTLLHLKQSSEAVGPLEVEHDHTTGRMRRLEGRDSLDLLRQANKGLTAKDLCWLLWEEDDPDRNTHERARRLLNGLVRKNLAVRSEGLPGFSQAVRWFAVDHRLGEPDGAEEPACEEWGEGR